MVVIQIKSSEHDTFLYETTCDTSNDQLIRELVEVWNLRLRLQQLAGGLRDVAKYGVMKPLDKQGIDHIEEQYNGSGNGLDRGSFYCEDPNGIRTGNGVGPQLSETMERVSRDAEAAISKDNVTRKLATTIPFLQEKLDNIRGSVIMAFPMGLPAYDVVRLTIEGIDGLDGTAAGAQSLDATTAELWVASRIFDRNSKVCDRLGRNEKTKVIGKLQKPGDGAPGREPVVSEDEKKAMMAYYFKKQEEMKKLSESSEDEYLHSSWADPKQLQRSLRGAGQIKAPGIL